MERATWPRAGRQTDIGAGVRELIGARRGATLGRHTIGALALACLSIPRLLFVLGATAHPFLDRAQMRAGRRHLCAEGVAQLGM
jgi:hypothetical protein